MPTASKWERSYKRWHKQRKANQRAIERGYDKINALVNRGIKPKTMLQRMFRWLRG